MRKAYAALIAFLLVFLVSPVAAQNVSFYQTTQDMTQKLQAQAHLSFSSTGSASLTITIDETKTYQQVEGFGASFTDSSAWLVYNKLTPTQRAAAMQSLFSRDNGIALSFIRQPMGASDLALNFYSYDDMPAGQSDPTLANFSIEHDRAYVIPVLKEALALNPNIKMMANPWSPPAWMKTNNSLLGVSGGTSGYLKQDAYAPLANYFVKYIKAYEAEGIKTDYISLQNEPLYAPPGYTGMLMNTSDQITLLKTHLAPAFASNGIKAKVMLYDHNWDRSDYVKTLLADSDVRAKSAGVAWHHYAGDPSAMTTVHDLYPEMDAWVTEASGGTWQTGNVMTDMGKELVYVMRNWSKAFVLWNMVLDQDHGPVGYTSDGQHGCDTCRGLLTVRWDKTNSGGASVVTNELDYYVLGHASKFLYPGAYRIASDLNSSNGIVNVAFRNPDGSIVLYAVNTSGADASFNVKFQGKFFTATVAKYSIATFVWSGSSAPTVSLSQQPNGITLTAGQSGSVTLTAQPVNGATPSVSFSCGVTDDTGVSTSKVTCTVAPNNLTFSDQNPQTLSVTISSAARSSGTQQGSLALPSAAWFSLLGVFLVGGVFQRKRSGLPVMCLVVLLGVGMTACGGSSSSGGTTPPNPPGGGTTTPTTYSATVTATTNTGSAVHICIPVLVK